MTDAVYTVGRFQPPTLGHVRMIDAMVDIAKGAPTFVFISSAKDSLIPTEMKMNYLRKMLTRNGTFPANLTLVNTSECKTPCGGPLGGWGYLKDRGFVGPRVLLFVGSDQAFNFDPASANMWKSIPNDERPSILSLERSGPGAAEFSSTKAREAIASGKSLAPFLKDGANAITDKDVAEMTSALLAVQSRWPRKKAGRRTRRQRMSRKRKLTRQRSNESVV